MTNIEAIFIFNWKCYMKHSVSFFVPCDRYRESYRRDKSTAVNLRDLRRNLSSGRFLSFLRSFKFRDHFNRTGHLLPEAGNNPATIRAEFRKTSEISPWRPWENQIEVSDLFPGVIRPIFEDDSCACDLSRHA